MVHRRSMIVMAAGVAVATGIGSMSAPAGAATRAPATGASTVTTATTAARPTCQGNVHAIDSAGALVMGWNDEVGRVGTRVDMSDADPQRRITAMADVYTEWDDGAPDEDYEISHEALVVSGGRLKQMKWALTTTGIDPLTGSGGIAIGTTTVVDDFGPGWGAMSSLHQAPMDWDAPARVRHLYGFSKGVLYRYRPVRSKDGRTTGFRSAGRAPGFSAVRGLALVASDSRADTFLASTSRGSLIRVTVPTSSRMTTSSVRLRNTGWSSYTTLVPARCSGTTAVVAVNAGGYGRLFTVGPAAGLRTKITPAKRTTDLRGMRALTSGSIMP